ncbi:DMT family transporter [Thalassospira sp.]|uniref:DMT family transporter n=1 Tax=Thalassospira sp. TaxID=1912094 RepID=UPI002733B90F|nr:DMT family transporter [Thalassospira sp.]MDP2699208.1 DMT family transporter [Thalassospira sp.]
MSGDKLRPARAMGGNLHGVLWMMAAMASGVCVDVCAKLVAAHVPTAQIIGMRALTTVAVFLIVLMFIGTRSIRTRRPYAHAARGILWYSSLFFVFFALRQMSIAEVNAYLFIESLLIVFLAVIFLGEKLTRRKLAAATLGLIGVWVMSAPAMNGFGVPLGIGAALIGAFCFSAQMLFAKVLTRTETNFSMLFWPQIVALVIWVPVAIVVWQPAAWTDWLYASGAGFFAMATNYMVLRAVRVADASVISPATYVALPFSVLVDLMFFDILPTPILIVGAGLIVGAVSLIDFRGGAKPLAEETTLTADQEDAAESPDENAETAPARI